MTMPADRHQRIETRMQRLVERPMVYAVEEYDDDAAVR